MKSIARWCFRHRRIVVLSWIVALFILSGASQGVGPSYHDAFNLPNTDSKKALDLLQGSFAQQSGESDQIVIHTKSGQVTDSDVKTSVTDMLAKVAALPHVKGVTSFYDETKATTNISKDGTIAFAEMTLDADENTTVPKQDALNIIKTAQAIDSDKIQVELAGSTIQFSQSDGPGATEAIGIVFAAIILFIAFGSIFTMFLPLLTAILALGSATAVIGLLTHVVTIGEFSPFLAGLIGIGVGVDYALFIVSRHRTNLLQGMDIEESVVTAINTSGRAVLFAGMTVCIGLAGLFVLGVSFLYGLAIAAIVAVLFTMFTAITFLPAMLGFVGIRALGKKSRKALDEHSGEVSHEQMSPTWYRWAKTIQRRPLAWGSLALIALLVIGIPTLSIRVGSTDAGGDPKSTTARQAYDLLATGFGAGFNGPLQLVAEIKSPADLTAFDNLGAAVAKDSAVGAVSPTIKNEAGTVALAVVYPKYSPQSVETDKLITRLHKTIVPQNEVGTTLATHVGGQTAIFQDFSKVLTSKYPLFFGIIIVLAFVLLMVVFRSLVIPLTASIMNLLAAAAGFGATVAVFQWGWLADVFGVDYTGPIQAFLPVIVFAIVFGLSMDYEVFLVSRMHEEWVRTNDNDEAISLGQAETGRVITAAATIMVFVFGSFLLGTDPTGKLFGLALAASILIDAALIRTILVPAVMHMLGRSNWYLPKWLDKALPTVSVEAHDAQEAAS